KTVTFAGYTMSGADADNYTLSQPDSSTADITPAGPTITAGSGTNKTYDSLTGDTITGTDSVHGHVIGDDVSGDASPADGPFADKNIGTAKTVAFAGYTIVGADAGNYTLSQPSSTADITPAQLTLIATGQNKVYDGNTSAMVTLAVNDTLGTDMVTANYGSAN